MSFEIVEIVPASLQRFDLDAAQLAYTINYKISKFLGKLPDRVITRELLARLSLSQRSLQKTREPSWLVSAINSVKFTGIGDRLFCIGLTRRDVQM